MLYSTFLKFDVFFFLKRTTDPSKMFNERVHTFSKLYGVVNTFFSWDKTSFDTKKALILHDNILKINRTKTLQNEWSILSI